MDFLKKTSGFDPSTMSIKTGIVAGSLIIDCVKRIDRDDFSEALPAFIAMIMMLLTYSIADGIYLGLISCVIIKLCLMQWKSLNITLVILSIPFITDFIYNK